MGIFENFLDRLERENILMHSLLVAKGDDVLYECYYRPYDADVLHRMFSVTKSFVSVCIGILEADDRISLEDKIIKYFPEYVDSDNVHPFLAATTIDDMLRMQSCHNMTTYKLDLNSDWVESFFTVTPSHAPGTVFSYDTSSTHTLCALIEKVTGMEFIDFVMERFGRKLGFLPESYCLKDPFGVSMGGSGLMLTTRDLMKFLRLVVSGGMYQGEQLIPDEYIKKAVSKLVDTTGKPSSTEEKQGYGYQFWQVRNGGYGCYGMGGQLAIYVPDKDVYFVTTADSQGISGGVQMIYQAFWDEIYDNLDKTQPDDSVHYRELPALSSNIDVATTGLAAILDKEIVVSENPAGLKSVRLEINGDEGVLNYTNATGSHALSFGLGHNVITKIPGYDTTAAVSAMVANDRSMWINAQLIHESIGTIWIELGIKDKWCTVLMRKVEENMFEEFDVFASGVIE